jgi:putative transposase
MHNGPDYSSIPPKRRRLSDDRPSVLDRPSVVFVTICTHDRIPVLATHHMHMIHRDIWMSSHDWVVGRYVIMPEHVHFFACSSRRGDRTLESWLSWTKREVAVRSGYSKGKLWQRRWWDTRIFLPEKYAEKLEYVHQNPVRRGLVKNTEDWLYAGEMTSLRISFRG